MRSVVKKKLSLYAAIALVAAVAIIALLTSLLQFAERADAAAQARDAAVIAQGVDDNIAFIASSVPNVIWDDAVRHLDNRFDRTWAHRNIGQFFHAAEGFEFAYVLDSENAPRYAMSEGVEVRPNTYARLESLAQPLITEVRHAEAQRVSQGGALPLEALRNRIQSTALRDIDGRLIVVTATLVQPDFGRVRIRNTRAPIVVSGRELDIAFTSQVAQELLLDNVALVRTLDHLQSNQAFVAIGDERNQTLAYYVWTPQRPGTSLLVDMLPILVLVLCSLAGLAFAFFLRARRYARGHAESEARTLHLAFHDSLTGLANRVRVEQRLTQGEVQHESQTFALHVIDLDRFKELNDTFGHAAGDELLRAVAGRLQSLCREGDLCARLGGDEFAILQLDADLERAAALAERIVATLDRPFGLSIGARHLGASVGVTLSSDPGGEALEWLRRADLALYAAKNAGRACFRFFDPSMDAATRERSLLRDDLEAALAQGDLDMVYQPQVNKMGAIVGVEALARWTHPVKGSISPALFVPLAEESGLINALGDFALKRVFEDSRKWPNLKIAVNVSSTQLQSPNFIPRLDRLIDETGIDPQRFELELTESVLLDESGHTRDKLQALRRRGFSLALDDFGTGYSSLSYLQHFPINKIKIDRSFVTNLGIGHEADEIIGAIVKLARALRLSVLAEGVETNEQWLRLQAVGCAEIQGFVAARPMAAADLSERLMTSTPYSTAHAQA
ncbi:MAG: EAL domain-containing protein [Hyphomonadaceae bacterium JAD_PAG50586_4]|nr:MAG: EAL domain-containing protein [Hyphomonadaceae bacterium JAD_PAG50586_4]